MSIPTFEFTRNWENPADFPTIESSEAQVRADLQALHDETKNYFNHVLLGQIQQELDEQKDWTREAVSGAVLGQLPEGSVSGEKLADGAVSQEKLSSEVRTPSPGALRVGQQRYDGSADLDLTTEGLRLDSASVEELGLEEGATVNTAMKLMAGLLGRAQIATGSYVGNGGVGEQAATVIDCGFAPKLVLVGSAENWASFDESIGEGSVWFEGVKRSCRFHNSGSDYTHWVNFQPQGTRLKFWASVSHTGEVNPSPSAEYQYNSAGKTYVYLALGVAEGA